MIQHIEVTIGSPSSPGSSPGRDSQYSVDSPLRHSSNARSDEDSQYSVDSPLRHSNARSDVSLDLSSGFTSPMDSPSRFSSLSSTASNSGTFAPLKLSFRQKLDVIDEEEEEYYDEDDYVVYGHNERFNKYLILALVFVSLFSLFCLIVWGASRPYKPRIAVKSLTINSFYYGEGSDYTGVPTKLLTVNCSVKMIISNPATFFGIHISFTPFDLFYSEITVASGQMGKYYQPRKSEQILFVNLEGNKVPLYGAGVSLAILDRRGRVPLRLEFDIRSRGDVMGKLVTSIYRMPVSCSLVFDSSFTKAIKFKENSCMYD